MSDLMTFPDSVEEFMNQYKVVDTEQVYTNGAELVPIFRMRQWFEHLPSAQRTGRWIYYPEINALSCSECKHYVYHYEPYKFCPNCGVEMEVEE